MNIVATVFFAPLNALRSIEKAAADAIQAAVRNKRQGNCGCGKSKSHKAPMCDECWRDSQW